jgi:hypothetical protein
MSTNTKYANKMTAELQRFKEQLAPEEYLVLERAINYGRVRFLGKLKWEDEAKKNLVFEVNSEDVLRMFSSVMVPESTRVTTPLYPSKLSPGYHRIRTNMKKYPDWEWRKEGADLGMYEVIADVEVYVGYQVGDKQLSGWYLRPIVINRSW